MRRFSSQCLATLVRPEPTLNIFAPLIRKIGGAHLFLVL